MADPIAYAIQLELTIQDTASAVLERVGKLVDDIEIKIKNATTQFGQFNKEVTQTQKVVTAINSAFTTTGKKASDLGGKLREINEIGSIAAKTELFGGDAERLNVVKLQLSELFDFQTNINKQIKEMTVSDETRDELQNDMLKKMEKFIDDKKTISLFTDKELNSQKEILEAVKEIQKYRTTPLKEQKDFVASLGDQVDAEISLREATKGVTAQNTNMQDTIGGTTNSLGLFREEKTKTEKNLQKMSGNVLPSVIGGFLGMSGAIATATAPLALLSAAFSDLSQTAEDFHTVNFRGIGSMEEMSAIVTQLTSQYPYLSKEVKNTITALRGFGLGRKEIDRLAEDNLLLARTTGASSEALAGFSASLLRVTGDGDKTSATITKMYSAAKLAGLAGHDLDVVMQQVTQSAVGLSVYGVGAVESYTNAMLAAAMAAKGIGIDTSRATASIDALKDMTTGFMVLGSDALRMGPAERIDEIIKKAPELNKIFQDMVQERGAGAAELVFKARYHIDPEQLKLLKKTAEEQEIILKMTPDQKAAKALEEAHEKMAQDAIKEATSIGREALIVGTKVFAALKVLLQPLYNIVMKIVGFIIEHPVAMKIASWGIALGAVSGAAALLLGKVTRLGGGVVGLAKSFLGFGAEKTKVEKNMIDMAGKVIPNVDTKFGRLLKTVKTFASEGWGKLGVWAKKTMPTFSHWFDFAGSKVKQFASYMITEAPSKIGSFFSDFASKYTPTLLEFGKTITTKMLPGVANLAGRGFQVLKSGVSGFTSSLGLSIKGLSLFSGAAGVAAAAVAGWEIGRWLDEMLGISEKISNWWGERSKDQEVDQRLSDAHIENWKNSRVALDTYNDALKKTGNTAQAERLGKNVAYYEGQINKVIKSEQERGEVQERFNKKLKEGKLAHEAYILALNKDVMAKDVAKTNVEREKRLAEHAKKVSEWKTKVTKEYRGITNTIGREVEAHDKQISIAADKILDKTQEIADNVIQPEPINVEMAKKTNDIAAEVMRVEPEIDITNKAQETASETMQTDAAKAAIIISDKISDAAEAIQIQPVEIEKKPETRANEVVTVKMTESPETSKTDMTVSNLSKIFGEVQKTNGLLAALVGDPNGEKVVELLKRYFPEMIDTTSNTGLAVAANQWVK